MKPRHLVFSIILTVAMLAVTHGAYILLKWMMHTPSSFEEYTFSLVTALIMIHFYNMSKENDKEE